MFSEVMRSRVGHLWEHRIRVTLKEPNDLREDARLREMQRACDRGGDTSTVMSIGCEKAGLGQLQKLPYREAAAATFHRHLLVQEDPMLRHAVGAGSRGVYWGIRLSSHPQAQRSPLRV